MNFILLVIGLVLLIKSADWLVDGASSLAGRFKISPLVIGLTIVAFGTSFPELVVNGYASFMGNSGIVLGNVIGSNIANILLILGVAAIIYPLQVQSSTIWKEIPFSFLAAIVAAVMAADVFLNNQAENLLTKADGIILLCFFAIFLYYLASLAQSSRAQQDDVPVYTNLKTGGLIAVGLVGLFFGGKWVVDGAVGLAQLIGMSERVIGLTVVAIGTSLPELVTSVVAALKKQSDISIGNVVGSNIFNLFWILGISAIIKPVPVVTSSLFDIGFLVAISTILFVLIFAGKKYHLTWWEGSTFILLYVSYLGYSILST